MQIGPMLCGLLLISALGAASAVAADKDKRLENCRELIAKIDKLESHRRRGGSAGQMDSWKRQIHRAQADYSRLNCKKLRRRL